MADIDRITSIGKQVAADGADALAVFASPHHSFQLTNAVQVLTGFRNMGSAAAFLFADGRRVLIVTPVWDGDRAREAAPGVEVVATDDLPAALAECLAGSTGTIGMAGLDELPMAIVGPVKDRLANRMRPMDDVILQAGRCKTPAEIAIAREMSVVAEKLFDRLLDTARPGMREYELAAEINCASREFGADDNFLLLCASQLHPSIRPPGRRVMEEGDVILAEISPGRAGAFVQICRTAVLGKPSEVLKTNYDLLWQSMEAGLAAARPGQTVASVAKAMDKVVADAGFGEYCRPPYMRVRGHGMGTISNLPGDIGKDNETVLEEGMTFVMHPNQFLPGSGYLLCGEPVVITATGCEPLTERHSKLTPIAL
jgi:Xaa-Pro aminopeptidase